MNDVITVRRANVILKVPVEQKSEYLAKGFDVLNQNGAVSEHTVPSDMNVLQKAYVEHLKEIDMLNEKLKNLSFTNTDDSDLQNEYDSLLDDYNELVEENEKLNSELENLNSKLENLTAEKASKKSSKKS